MNKRDQFLCNTLTLPFGITDRQQNFLKEGIGCRKDYFG
jgi:hypothetical protein